MDGKFSARPYHAPWWLRNPHAQTVLGRLLRRPRPPEFRRERIELPDGDFVDLDEPVHPLTAGPLVLLLHGLEGSARRPYAVNTYRELAAHGIRSVGLNFRSCSGEQNRTARFYHSGETSDIRHVLELLADRYPGVPRGAVGFSLGGNAMLKLLGELGDSAGALLGAAVAVSVPYDLAAGADALDSSRIGRFYTSVFVKSLVAKAGLKAALLGDSCDLDRIRGSRSFRDFDDAATAPIHGFASADDYYTRSSSAAFIPRIRIPTLLLHAADDPFLPVHAFPHDAVKENPCVDALVTAHGGHVGFIHGTPWAPRFWAEETAASFLAARLLDTFPRS